MRINVLSSFKKLAVLSFAIAFSVAVPCCGNNGSGKLETVKIGGKTWMKKNLNVETDGSWCYNNDPANCKKYGRLYTWESAKNACASLGNGWRLPSNEDWSSLSMAVGAGDGTKLKSKSGWESDGNGTDQYGFSALPGGDRNRDGAFAGTGLYGYWWSATEENGTDVAWNRNMQWDQHMGKDHSYKDHGLSVRCVAGN